MEYISHAAEQKTQKALVNLLYYAIWNWCNIYGLLFIYEGITKIFVEFKIDAYFSSVGLFHSTFLSDC